MIFFRSSLMPSGITMVQRYHFHGSHPGASTGDARIPRRAFEHAHARLEIAARLGALEHVEVDAVLETARAPYHSTLT